MLGRCNPISRKGQATVLQEHRKMSVGRAMCGGDPNHSLAKAVLPCSGCVEADCCGRSPKGQGGWWGCVVIKGVQTKAQSKRKSVRSVAAAWS